MSNNQEHYDAAARRPGNFFDRPHEQQVYERHVKRDQQRGRLKQVVGMFSTKPARGSVYGFCLKALSHRVAGLTVVEAADLLDAPKVVIASFDQRLRDSTRGQLTVNGLRETAVQQGLVTPDEIAPMIAAEVKETRQSLGWCPKSE